MNGNLALLFCRQAMSDLEVGRIVFEAGKWSYACFLSQQSSEKSLMLLTAHMDPFPDRSNGATSGSA